jgi:enediyne biosynthesis protein E4
LGIFSKKKSNRNGKNMPLNPHTKSNLTPTLPYTLNLLPRTPKSTNPTNPRTMFRLLAAALTATSFFLNACQRPQTRFQLRAADQTGIDFANVITERDTLNILDMEFVYNGGGVAIGDLNGDGLDDLYFTGNQVDNRLYLNRGNLRFEDVTKASGTGKTMPYQWSSGINLIDLNRDGRLDIYVCNTTNPDPEQRRNLLFINVGNDAQGIPLFEEKARAYGLDDANHDSHAQFFDMDNDGDLDLFLGVNFIDHQYPNQFVTRTTDGSAPTRDLLLRNDWSDALGHPVFTDVSLAAGIVYAGYSHSTLIHDFDQDGWLDIFVCNDYLSNDLLYLNQRDGTFKNRVADILRHQAMSSMGSDLADANNDGQLDFFVTEMQPWYNKRKKLFQGGSSYQMYLFNDQYNYEYQYTRNMLQLNRGIDPATKLPMFSEVGMYAGVQETDWSWTPLMADLDNDGLRDLYVTNGFPRDVTDHDFAEFRKGVAATLTSKNDLYQMIPQIKQPNFMFQNRMEWGSGVPRYDEVSTAWGLAIPSFTNGAAYGDLDGDGDLDLVCNNIDDAAFLFENQTITKKGNPTTTANYLRVRVAGMAQNPDAIGAVVTAWWGGQCQSASILSGRGYLSASERTVHVGLGAAAQVDSLRVTWPRVGTTQKTVVLRNLPANQTHDVRPDQPDAAPPVAASFFWGVENVAQALGLIYENAENDHIDFNFQRTLPHKVSQYGPCVAVGDVTGDGLADVFVGGSSRYGEHWFFQQKNGAFRPDSALYKTDENQREEDSAALLFDADGDGDLDLYLGRGSGQHPADDTLYRDVLLRNDGTGRFRADRAALPDLTTNTSVVRAADFDADGDLDLFVGSRVRPKSYPLPDRSYLLENDGKGNFRDVTDQKMPNLAQIGMVSDAVWSDFDGDHWPDLVLVGEFMQPVFVRNAGGHFQALTTDLPVGWWNSVVPADLDNDGDMDYVITNFGQNLYFRAAPAEPLRVIAKDFDNNGWVDPFLSQFWLDSLRVRREYVYHPREDAVKQLVTLRKKFKTYGEYGAATTDAFFTKNELEGATILAATELRSGLLENLGNGQWRYQPLPPAAQIAPLYGALARDVDGDGLLDLLLSGNDYGMELQQGRADAFCGLVLRQVTPWQFAPLTPQQSGWVVGGDARGIAALALGTDREVLLAMQNRGPMRVFSTKKGQKTGGVLAAQPTEVYAQVVLRDGKIRRVELPWGVGFAAQSGRHVATDASVREVIFFDKKGKETRRAIE